jgi:hypothetical protein
MRLYPKYTPFAKLSKHKQRDAYIKLRGEIKRTQSEYGQNFTSRYLFEPERPTIYNQDFEFYFLGLDGHTIWNASLTSATHDYEVKISEIASNKSYELKSTSESNFQDRFIPVYDSIGRLKHYTMEPEKPSPEFGDRTRYEWMRDYESDLIKNDTGSTAPVYEYIHFDTSYKYGIGLHAVLDLPEVNAETIEGMIARFRAMGEKEWQSDTPVPHSRMPKDTFSKIVSTQKLDTWPPITQHAAA